MQDNFKYVVLLNRDIKSNMFQPMIVNELNLINYNPRSGLQDVIFENDFVTFQQAQDRANELNVKMWYGVRYIL